MPTCYALKLLTSAHSPKTPTMWDTLAQTLQDAGHQVEWIEVEQPTEAITEQLRLNPNDALLLDPELNLSQDSNGTSSLTALALCDLLRQSPETEHMPIIMLASGNVSTQDLYAALKAHATDYINGNADNEWIQARLAFVIEQQQALHQAQALANQMSELNKELYERNLQVEKELYVARQLQQSLLPSFLKDDPRETEFTP